jgi:hypothetical protein
VSIAVRWRAASDNRMMDASSFFAGAAGSRASSALGGVPRPHPTVNAVHRITVATPGVVNQIDGL